MDPTSERLLADLRDARKRQLEAGKRCDQALVRTEIDHSADATIDLRIAAKEYKVALEAYVDAVKAFSDYSFQQSSQK